MLALPQTPQELVVKNALSRLGSGAGTPAARVTSSTLYVFCPYVRGVPGVGGAAVGPDTPSGTSVVTASTLAA